MSIDRWKAMAMADARWAVCQPVRKWSTSIHLRISVVHSPSMVRRSLDLAPRQRSKRRRMPGVGAQARRGVIPSTPGARTTTVAPSHACLLWRHASRGGDVLRHGADDGAPSVASMARQPLGASRHRGAVGAAGIGVASEDRSSKVLAVCSLGVMNGVDRLVTLILLGRNMR